MISVLLSVHNNTNKLLDKTLKSVLDQTDVDWELIVVDDGSKDSTHETLVELERQNRQRFKVITNESNIGLTKSLIIAAQLAKGEFIARIDAGDQFLPGKLSKQLDFMRAHNDVGIVGCNYVNIFSHSGKLMNSDLPITDTEIRRSIMKRNPFAHSCVLMRTVIYKKAGGYNPDIKYGQDYDLWFRILKECKAANLNEILCRRMVDNESISYRKQREQMRQCVLTQWHYMNKLNPMHYLYLAEPLALAFLPHWLMEYLRRLMR